MCGINDTIIELVNPNSNVVFEHGMEYWCNSRKNYVQEIVPVRDEHGCYYWLVEAETEGFYPYPLLFSTREEREASAKEAGKPCPSEEWVKQKILQCAQDEIPLKEEKYGPMLANLASTNDDEVKQAPNWAC